MEDPTIGVICVLGFIMGSKTGQVQLDEDG